MTGAWLASAPARVHAQNPVADSLKALATDERLSSLARGKQSLQTDTLPLSAALPDSISLSERLDAVSKVLGYRLINVPDSARFSACSLAKSLGDDPDVRAYFPDYLSRYITGSAAPGCALRAEAQPRVRPWWMLWRMRREADRGIVADAIVEVGGGVSHVETFTLEGKRTRAGLVDLRVREMKIYSMAVV